MGGQRSEILIHRQLVVVCSCVHVAFIQVNNIDRFYLSMSCVSDPSCNIVPFIRHCIVEKEDRDSRQPAWHINQPGMISYLLYWPNISISWSSLLINLVDNENGLIELGHQGDMILWWQPKQRGEREGRLQWETVDVVVQVIICEESQRNSSLFWRFMFGCENPAFLPSQECKNVALLYVGSIWHWVCCWEMIERDMGCCNKCRPTGQ